MADFFTIWYCVGFIYFWGYIYGLLVSLELEKTRHLFLAGLLAAIWPVSCAYAEWHVWSKKRGQQ